MNFITQTLRAAGLAAAVAVATVPAQVAQAATVSYDFAVTVDVGNVGIVGNTYTGSFSYDDASMADIGFNGEELFTLSDFSFSFDNTPYDKTDLTTAYAAVFNGNFIGLDVEALVFSLVSDISGAPFFVYDLQTGVGFNGSGSVVYTQEPGAVPEPSGAALALAALGLLAMRRR